MGIDLGDGQGLVPFAAVTEMKVEEHMMSEWLEIGFTDDEGASQWAKVKLSRIAEGKDALLGRLQHYYTRHLASVAYREQRAAEQAEGTDAEA